jgi:hypothetical protein
MGLYTSSHACIEIGFTSTILRHATSHLASACAILYVVATSNWKMQLHLRKSSFATLPSECGFHTTRLHLRASMFSLQQLDRTAPLSQSLMWRIPSRCRLPFVTKVPVRFPRAYTAQSSYAQLSTDIYDPYWFAIAIAFARKQRLSEN